jgi:transcriptional regulator of met regulon
MMHEPEKSDLAIVAVKPANKVEPPAPERSAAKRKAAEPVERRAGTKGNADQQSTYRTQSRASVSQALERIRQVARERKKERFTALFHHINTELLAEAFFELEENAAPGVDRLTWKDYEADLERNLEICTTGSNEERIGHCRHDGSTFPSRTAGSARWPSPPWRTRSSNGRWLHC